MRYYSYSSPSFGFEDYYSYGGYSDVLRIGGSILLAFATFICLYVIVAWIFKSVGLHHMAKNRGIAHAWFAWIPILSNYVLGELDNDKVVLGDDLVLGHASFFLPFISFLACAVGYGSMGDGEWVVAIIGACAFVYKLAALWRLFKIYRPKNRVSFTIWSALIGSGFFIFAIRDDKPFDPLEPNRVYGNYYGQKSTLDSEYKEAKEQVREERKEELSNIKNHYEEEIKAPNITSDQKKAYRQEYHNDVKSVEEKAREVLHEDRDIYHQDLEMIQKATENQNAKENVLYGQDVAPEESVDVISLEETLEAIKNARYEEE